MIIISSRKTTVLDWKLKNCTVDYDDEELIAICDKFPNEQFFIQETNDHIINYNFYLKSKAQNHLVSCNGYDIIKKTISPARYNSQRGGTTAPLNPPLK